jgi:hypothetical protein
MFSAKIQHSLNDNCERPSAAVPRELPLDGLSPADLAQLGVGDFNMERNTMTEQWMGVVRHVLTAVGAVMVAMGYMDDTMWTTIMGAMMTLVPFVWSWKSKV